MTYGYLITRRISINIQPKTVRKDDLSLFAIDLSTGIIAYTSRYGVSRYGLSLLGVHIFIAINPQ